MVTGHTTAVLRSSGRRQTQRRSWRMDAHEAALSWGRGNVRGAVRCLARCLSGRPAGRLGLTESGRPLSLGGWGAPGAVVDKS